jgi:hypothetical protein
LAEAFDNSSDRSFDVRRESLSASDSESLSVEDQDEPGLSYGTLHPLNETSADDTGDREGKGTSL